MASSQCHPHSLPPACEVLTHAGDGVGSEGKGHDPCGIDGAQEDGQAGLVGKVAGFEDGGHSGGHGWGREGGAAVCAAIVGVGDEQVLT